MKLTRTLALGGVYLAVAAAFTLSARACEQQLRRQGCMQFTCVNRATGARLSEVRRPVDLSFLDQHPEYPRRFISATWTGYWYLPSALTVDFYAGGDDRVIFRVDHEPILSRGPQVGMNTGKRTLRLAEGVQRVEMSTNRMAAA